VGSEAMDKETTGEDNPASQNTAEPTDSMPDTIPHPAPNVVPASAPDTVADPPAAKLSVSQAEELPALPPQVGK